VNDADRLCRDPAMRWVVGGQAPMGRAASTSQMGRPTWQAGYPIALSCTAPRAQGPRHALDADREAILEGLAVRPRPAAITSSGNARTTTVRAFTPEEFGKIAAEAPAMT